MSRFSVVSNSVDVLLVSSEDNELLASRRVNDFAAMVVSGSGDKSGELSPRRRCEIINVNGASHVQIKATCSDGGGGKIRFQTKQGIFIVLCVRTCHYELVLVDFSHAMSLQVDWQIWPVCK